MSGLRGTTRLLVLIACAAFSGCCAHHCGMTGHDVAAIESDCSTCGDSCGPPCGGLFSPIPYFLGCGSGCGEIYFDEWLSDPPECCDPCDNCGNWIGQPAWCRWHGFPLHWGNLWGTRHVCEECGACSDCDHGTGASMWEDGEIIE